jgi:hypothetical protein
MSEILGEIRNLLAALVERQHVPEVDARFLDVQSAARFTSLSPESIRRLLSAGKLTPLRPVRGRVLIDRLQLESYVAGSVQTLRRGRGRRQREA